MTSHDPSKPEYLWAGVGISMGAGIGVIIGLLGWGAEGIAFGLLIGSGIGLVLGASYDSVGRRRRSQSGNRPPD